MASFAKAQLLKFGWTEGKGLGKNENGMVEALKPKLKFDTAGIGHDAKEFKWWESVYEKASKNIEIIPKEKGQSEMRVKAKEADAVRISTSRYGVENGPIKNDARYGNFLKSCTLDNAQTAEENPPEMKEETRRVGEELTDEQLFAACGGRTAHKGARHGLKLSGKLARIARQEAKLLEASRAVQPPKEPADAAQQWQSVENKKSKKRKRDKSTNIEMIDLESLEKVDGKYSNENVCCGSRTSKKSRKSKKKEKRSFQELTSILDAFAIDDKRASRTDNSIITINLEEEEQEVEKIVKLSEAERANLRIEKRKRKSRMKRESKRVENLSDSLMAVNLSENSVQSEQLSEELRAKLKKKRKKKREIGKLKKSKSL